MQYHASLITADGAYLCPVGSVMAIFLCLQPENTQIETKFPQLVHFSLC